MRRRFSSFIPWHLSLLVPLIMPPALAHHQQREAMPSGYAGVSPEGVTSSTEEPCLHQGGALPGRRAAARGDRDLVVGAHWRAWRSSAPTPTGRDMQRRSTPAGLLTNRP